VQRDGTEEGMTVDDRRNDMERDREMLRNPKGHGSSPGPEGTDPDKAQQPVPTPGDEHLGEGGDD
jgi:hypothetical protein